MSDLPVIELQSDWQHTDDGYRHDFFVEVTDDICLRYWLMIDADPIGLEVAINDHVLPVTSAPFRVDVTDVVMLDDNSLTLQFHEEGASVRRVWLEATPCP
jgi:hypothetical protein